MSGRLHSKQSWPGSPGRKRFGSERVFSVRNDQRDPISSDRSKRGRWELPSRRHMDSLSRTRLDSPKWMRRRDRAEEEHPLGMGCHEGQGPAGLVFLCSSTTLRECFHYRVLGLPAAEREVVERVIPGTKLFLFNFDTKELFGVFEATSCGGLDLVPEAFLDCKVAYAAQVRFNILKECLPLSYELVRDVLVQNCSQRGTFRPELNGDQVQKIMQLFSRPGGDPVRDREKHALGMHGFESDGGHLPSSQGPFIQESQFLLHRPLPDGLTPDPAVILGKGMIDEVDQLALKYLHNHPGFAGFRLDPINMSLLSTTLTKSFPVSLMDHSLTPGGGVGGVHVSGPLPASPFPAGGGGGIPNPRLLGYHGSSVLDTENMGRSSADGGKTSGHILPSSTLSDRGLLPIPPFQPGIPPPRILNQPGFSLPHGIPTQPGMAHAGGRFPMDAGPMVGVCPELGGPFVPLHLQGSHGPQAHVREPLSLFNTSAAPANRPNHQQQSAPQNGANKLKKKKQKNKSKLQKDGKDAKNDEDFGN